MEVSPFWLFCNFNLKLQAFVQSTEWLTAPTERGLGYRVQLTWKYRRARVLCWRPYISTVYMIKTLFSVGYGRLNGWGLETEKVVRNLHLEVRVHGCIVFYTCLPWISTLFPPPLPLFGNHMYLLHSNQLVLGESTFLGICFFSMISKLSEGY